MKTIARCYLPKGLHPPISRQFGPAKSDSVHVSYTLFFPPNVLSTSYLMVMEQVTSINGTNVCPRVECGASIPSGWLYSVVYTQRQVDLGLHLHMGVHWGKCEITLINLWISHSFTFRPLHVIKIIEFLFLFWVIIHQNYGGCCTFMCIEPFVYILFLG